jgi:signal recognition particle GTPase
VTTSDVNGLLKQFKMVQQMMKGVGKGKMPRLPKELADMDLSQLQP